MKKTNEAGTREHGKAISALYITIILLIVTASNIIWLKLDRVPQAWDESRHLQPAIAFYKILSTHPLDAIKQFITGDNYYPPLVPFLASFLGFTGQEQDNFTYLMIFFQIIIVIFVFLYARDELGTLPAFAAAAIITTYPVMIGEGRVFMLDIPLAAAYIVFIYTSNKLQFFSNRNCAITAGVIAGLGMLIKWTFLFFMLPPLAFIAYEGIKDHKFERGSGKNIFFFIAAMAAVAAPWYMYNFVSLAQGAVKNGVERQVVENIPAVFSAGSAVYYFITMWQDMGPFFFIVFGAGAVLAAADRKNRKILVIFLAGLVLFMLIPNKKNRYIMPLFPLAAVISSVIVRRLEGRKVAGTAVTAFIVAAAFANYAFVSFKMPFDWPGEKRPDASDWRVKEFLDKMPKDTLNTLAVVPDSRSMNGFIYGYYTQLQYPGVKVTGISNFPIFADYFILKTGDLGQIFSGLEKRQALVNEILSDGSPYRDHYELIHEADLPDGSKGMLFKRKDSVAVDDGDFLPKIRKNINSLVREYARKTRNLACKIQKKEGSAMIDRLNISADEAFVGDFKHKDAGMRVTNFNAAIKGLLVDGKSLNEGKLRIMGLKGVDIISLEIAAGDLAEFLKFYSKKVSGTRILFENNQVDFSAVFGRVPVNAVFKLFNPNPGTEDSDVVFRITKLKIGFFEIPAGLANFICRGYNPLLNRSHAPVKIRFNNITEEGNKLKIN